MKNSLVVIGGGTGSFSILSGLRNHPVELSSIVTMMDSGGTPACFGTPMACCHPGDLRRCLIALSDESEILRELGIEVIWRKGIMAADSLVRHDPERTAAALMDLSETLLKV